MIGEQALPIWWIMNSSEILKTDKQVLISNIDSIYDGQLLGEAGPLSLFYKY